MDMTSSPEEGINGDLEVNKLIADGVHLDKIQFFVESSDVNMTFRGQVQNFESNPQYTFNALFDGYLLEHGAGVNVKLYDDKDRLGVKLGAEAIMETEGIRLRLLSDETILGYKKRRYWDIRSSASTTITTSSSAKTNDCRHDSP